MVVGTPYEPMQPVVARAIVSHLSQQRTNGKSKLGTMMAPMLPAFLSNNPMPNGRPWSNMGLETNYYKDHPHTGVIRSYDFTVSRGIIAPDGYHREGLLVNGAFPGPLIEANWGDTIQVTVHNNITDDEEGVALHWHGFLQTGKPWEDGVPAVTQCPIAPGQSYTYSFEAELYGTTWYHSHYSSQFAGGLLGPMVIYGPPERHYDIDVGPVMVSDWYHKNYYDLVEKTMSPNNTPFPSNNTLINGKNNFNCTKVEKDDKSLCIENAGIAKFRFRRGKVHRLRLINAGAEALQRFTIDGHTMTVIANDFVTVEPYDTKVVTLGIGQRTDVLVKADGKLDSYWMRTNVSEPCSVTLQPYGVAAIYYEGANQNKAPRSTPWDVPDPGHCGNDDLRLTRPAMKLRLPEPDVTYHMDVQLIKNASDIKLWHMDDIAYRGNYNSPTLLLASVGNATMEKEWHVKNTKNARSVRVVLRNKTPVAHPMHLHGFNMYVLHEGEGDWNGTIVHPENPQRRDVVQMRKDGHLVMQFDAAGNPGVWPFHCHIAWHASGGFFMQFVTGEAQLRRMRPPQVVAETCRQWARWTGTNIPDQIDSGL
ncbi:hypothetical protein HIM_05768 [Hirsutella minnesotensis 3608]|uniref:Laccase-2 n=1 Tax=Hirsutella minnesotensis 3608 TaxID=1043627 RepID=A0A0F8A579_9HYPO|nr:hypothetical protein HIM_05768 [Hirsutella minnesotensis 3608]